jgi:hypothetical protein
VLSGASFFFPSTICLLLIAIARQLPCGDIHLWHLAGQREIVVVAGDDKQTWKGVPVRGDVERLSA